MAGVKIRYQYQNYYSKWLEEKQGPHRLQRHLYKLLTMLTLLVAVIAISAVVGSGRGSSRQKRQFEKGLQSANRNTSYTPIGSSTGRRLMESGEEETYEENEGVDVRLRSHIVGPPPPPHRRSDSPTHYKNPKIYMTLKQFYIGS